MLDPLGQLVASVAALFMEFILQAVNRLSSSSMQVFMVIVFPEMGIDDRLSSA